MPRKSRERSPIGIYHVMLRGLNRDNIFIDDQDRRKFLKCLNIASRQYDDDGNIVQTRCAIHAYCLMDNHVHILISEKTEDVGSFMKRVGVSYVSYYNKRYERIGPLFQGRFRSEPVNDAGYFIRLLRYIHQNPVEANIVNYPDEYAWSSWKEYNIDRDISNNSFLCSQSIPFSNMSWKELCELVKAVNKTIIKPETNGRKRMSDNDARLILSRIYSTDDFKSVPRKEISRLLPKALKSGIGMRQFSRITQIAYGSIQRMLVH